MFDKIIDGLAKAIMGVSSLLVFVITFLQVICRFVLKSPLPWSTDILRLAFTYLVFWGAAWCVREKEHLNVDVVLTAMPAGMRRTVEILINVVLCGFFIFLIYFGIQFADHVLPAAADVGLLCQHSQRWRGDALLHGEDSYKTASRKR